ncbi:MAG: isopentenyl phosphate kinase [Candidatus Aenigmatarchaeota archaeon]
MKPLIILKIRGSVITDKHSEEPKVNSDSLRRISKEIANAYSEDSFGLVVIHGAGSYGHQIVKRTGIHKGITSREQLEAFAETQRLQNELNSIVTKAMIEEGLPAIPTQVSSHAIMFRGELLRMDIECIKGLVDIGMIPVLYGVPAYDMKQKCSILSGDKIAPYVAKFLSAKKIIHGTNVDGVFTADPNKFANARLISEVNKENLEEVKRKLGGSTAVDVTGGMYSKVVELLNLGIESQIVNANVPGNIEKTLKGERIGTAIRM